MPIEKTKKQMNIVNGKKMKTEILVVDRNIVMELFVGQNGGQIGLQMQLEMRFLKRVIKIRKKLINF